MSEPQQSRYGVFLQPDAKTSAAVTTITTCLRAQFGVVSAGRFPPHVTLAGSLPLAVAEAVLLEAVEAVAHRSAPVRLVNHGVRRLDFGLAFDVHHGPDGRPNEALVELTAAVVDAVRPLIGPAEGLEPDVRDREDWRGHLSVASHDLRERPELRAEIEEFVAQLDQPYPERFTATRLAVYRLRHPSWGPAWWREFSWDHAASFLLGGPRPG